MCQGGATCTTPGKPGSTVRPRTYNAALSCSQALIAVLPCVQSCSCLGTVEVSTFGDLAIPQHKKHARTYTHTHTHTLSLSLTHSLTHTLSHTLSHTHTLTHTLSHTHTHSLTHTHTLSHTHTHSHTLTLSHSHTLALSTLTHPRSHAPTHTRADAQSRSKMHSFACGWSPKCRTHPSGANDAAHHPSDERARFKQQIRIFLQSSTAPPLVHAAPLHPNKLQLL